MNVSLVVYRVGADTAKNIERMDLAVTQSAKSGAHLVLFSEAATTGLILNNDPRHDLMLGEPVPGPAVAHFADLAKSSRIHIAFGILERDGAALYDTCLLYTSDAADDLLCVDLGGRRIIKKKKKK